MVGQLAAARFLTAHNYELPKGLICSKCLRVHIIGIDVVRSMRTRDILEKEDESILVAVSASAAFARMKAMIFPADVVVVDTELLDGVADALSDETESVGQVVILMGKSDADSDINRRQLDSKATAKQIARAIQEATEKTAGGNAAPTSEGETKREAHRCASHTM